MGFDLRTFWNASIGGKFYRLDQSTTYKTSSDEWYNYHSTTPEYTPGYDKSGRKDVVLTPLGGIKKLVVKPNKTTKKFSDSLKIDISDAGLMSASGDLTDYLNFEKPISLSKEGNSSGNNKGKKATIPKGHDHIFDKLVGDLKVLRRSEKALGRDFEKNNDKITGRYDGRFITRDKNNKKISKTWRTAFHLDFKDMDIHSTTTLLARNTLRQIYYYPGTQYTFRPRLLWRKIQREANI